MAYDPTTGNYTSLDDTGYSREQVTGFFSSLAAESGASIESGDVQGLINKLMGGSTYMRVHGGNPERAFDEYRESYRRRGAPTSHRMVDSQSGLYTNIGGDPRLEPGFGTEYRTPESGAISGGPILIRSIVVPSPAPLREAAPIIAETQGDVGITPSPHTSGPPGPLGYASYDQQYQPAPVSFDYAATSTVPTGGGLSMTTLIVIGGAAIAAILLMRKR